MRIFFERSRTRQLAEVKAILHRLQALAAETGTGVPAAAGGDTGHANRIAIMCAEAVWWRCHRRIIADYLLAAGDEVFHILGRNHIERAHLTPAANLGSTGALTYPADASNELPLLKSF